jgi:transposase
MSYASVMMSALPLEGLSRRGHGAHRMVVRARIVLLAADGVTNCAIAQQLGICEDTARKWRRRYRGQGIDGLCDAPRPGRLLRPSAQAAHPR